MASQRLVEDWLQGYLAYTAESESPDTFHLWVALSAIAGAVRRHIHFPMGYFDVFPNLYTVLVAPAGRCKKSTAMRIGRHLLEQVPGVTLTVDSITRERLVQDMAQTLHEGESALTSHSSEFGSLLTSSGAEMVMFLTDIFDCPKLWTHRTKTSGTNVITGPFLNLLAATTPEWLARSLPIDTVWVGLTSRVIFVYADTPRERSPFITLSTEQRELERLLLDDLTKMSTLQGEYTLDAAARTAYEMWYRTRWNENHIDPRLVGFYERKHIHLLKLALLIAAARRDDPVITLDDYTRAQALITDIETPMAKTFAGVGKNPLTFGFQQVADLIRGHPGITQNEITDAVKHDYRRDDISEILSTLVAVGSAKPVPNSKGFTFFPLEPVHADPAPADPTPAD